MDKLSHEGVLKFASENNCTYATAFRVLERRSVGLPTETFGGEGSGHHGHGGLEGVHGGSEPGDGGGKKTKMPTNPAYMIGPDFKYLLATATKSGLKKALSELRNAPYTPERGQRMSDLRSAIE